MKKSFILSIIGLLLSILPVIAADVTNSTENLVFGKMWMEGGCRAKLVQRLHVEVTNQGTEDYRAHWDAFDPQGTDSYDSSRLLACCSGANPNIKAGQTEDVTMELEFYKPGHYVVNVWTDRGATELFSYPVDIAEYQTPRIKGDIRLDMLEKTDEGNILYGDFAHFRISGTATITNEDENTVIGWGNLPDDGGGGGIQCNVQPWFGENYWNYQWLYDLGHEIKPGETITKDFTYDFMFKAVPEKDKEYGIQIDVVGNTVARIPFKVKQCTNTYWTADGHVKPLPVGPNQVLKVPSEALAVDMRGQYEMNTVFSVDISQANPNCLYYLGYLDNVPQGFSNENNLVRDNEAKMLFVDADYDYFCPMSFKAKTAFFIYTPVSERNGRPNPTMNQMMSGTLILPFDATQAWLTTANDSQDNDGSKYEPNIRLYRLVSDGDGVNVDLEFERVLLMKAYEPYLLLVKPSPVSFCAENVIIPSTRPAVKKGLRYDFVGHTTAMISPKNAYTWIADNYCFTYKDALVRPFSAILYSTKDEDKSIGTVCQSVFTVFEKGNEYPLTVKTLVNETSTPVYSLSGQRVGTARINEGKLSVSGIKPGLYIINGRKIVIK